MNPQTHLNGLYAIIPTPAKDGAEAWDAVDTVDLAETERVVRKLVDAGAAGLVALGTTGECATLTPSEYEAFVDCVLSTIGGRIPTFIGVSALGLHEVVARTRFSKARGATGILAGLPQWQPCTEDMAVEFYRTLSAAFPDLQIMIYANSRAFRFPFGPSFLRRIVDAAPTVTSAKFARPADFPAAQKAVGGKIHLLPSDSTMMAFYDMDPEATTACWSTAASMGPEPSFAIVDAIREGRIDDARKVAKDIAWAGEPLAPFVADPEVFASYNIQVEKIRISAAGYCNAGPVRPPYHVVPDDLVVRSRENAARWNTLRTKYARSSVSA